MVILILVDDVTFLLAHASPSCPVERAPNQRANQRATDVGRILNGRLGLSPQKNESFNIAISPANFAVGIFRRGQLLARTAQLDRDKRGWQLAP